MLVITVILLIINLLLLTYFLYFSKQKKLLLLKRHFLSCIKNSDIPIIVLDDQQNIAKANAKALTILQYEASDLKNRPIDFIFSNLENYFIHEIVTFQHLIGITKIGNSIAFNIIEIPILLDDQISRMLIFQDRSQDVLREKELHLALQEAQMATQTKKLFLANMGHEIKTPLNAILGFSEILEEGLYSTKEHEYASIVKDNAKHLNQIIDDILDMSQLEKDQFQIEPHPFNIHSTLTDIEKQIKDYIGLKKIIFRTQYEFSGKTLLVGDDFRIKQILLHLLKNAVKFTENGEIELKALLSQSTVNHQAEICFTISDTGIGIDTNFIHDFLGIPFTQEDPTHKRKHGGLGLGLSLVKNIVEHMDGTISINAEKGTGTEITLTLPFNFSGHHANMILNS